MNLEFVQRRKVIIESSSGLYIDEIENLTPEAIRLSENFTGGKCLVVLDQRLYMRHQRINMTDADERTQLARVQNAATDASNQASHNISLGNEMLERFEREGSLNDLDAAVKAYQEALRDMTATH